MLMDEGKDHDQAVAICNTMWDQRDNRAALAIERRRHLHQTRYGYESRRDYLSRDPKYLDFLRSDSLLLTPSDLVAALKNAFPDATVVSTGGKEYWDLEVHIGRDDVTPVACIRVECDYSATGRPVPVGYMIWDKAGSLTTVDDLVDRLGGI